MYKRNKQPLPGPHLRLVPLPALSGPPRFEEPFGRAGFDRALRPRNAQHMLYPAIH